MERFAQDFRRGSPAPGAAINAAAFVLFSVVAAYLAAQSKVVQAQPCVGPGGRIVSVEGDMSISGLPTQMGDEFCLGEEIIVGQKSRAAIRLAATQTVVRVKQNSTFVVDESADGGPLIKMLKGVLYLFSRRPQNLSVETPYVNAAIDGTEFVIESSDERSEVTVIEGVVRVSNARGNVRVTPGETANAGINGAPLLRTVIEPLDAVQWALYYPSIGVAENTTATVRSAAESLSRGDIENAERLLADSPEDAASLALRSIIAVTRNESAQAFQLAQRAVNFSPDSSLAYSAMSYAQQASFDLTAAWRSALRAVQIDDENVFALSRLAEVEISRGYFQLALSYAKRAVDIEPTYSRNHSMIGFVQLNIRDYSEARVAFEKAVALDNSDPMPHLGLGLVMFKNNQVVEARKFIETAVSLDPINSLYRSYLGKAYYEEAEPEFADQQFELAKIFDENDPTPWYYDAISSSPNTTKIQELDNLEKAIRLNGNRAIYRSKFALDSDLATRGVNLAQLYQQLGANRQATIEATRSLGIDPSNHSAHRFLAGAYAQRPRHEIARVSELLQSKLLNPLNSDPIVPSSSFSYTDSALESGASIVPGHYEYASVFERNGPKFRAAVVAGTQDQFNGDLAGSWLLDNAIFSAGISSQNSQGYRPNNDASSEMQNVFSQWTPNGRVSFQAEFRHRSSRQGDLNQQFDLTAFSTDLRRKVITDIFRIGSNLKTSNGSELLLSGVVSSIDSDFKNRVLVPGRPSLDIDSNTVVDAKQLEFQYILSRPQFSTIAGFSTVDSERNSSRIVSVGADILPSQNQAEDGAENNAYVYLNQQIGSDLDVTLGAAYSEQDIDESNERLVQPKFGLSWQFAENAKLRLAYFKTLKRFLVADQSIEPTQLMGFNQLYDDTDGTKTNRIGAALDLRLDDRLAMSLEASQRISDHIVAEIVNERRERTLNASLFWADNKHLALAGELIIDHYENIDPLEGVANFVTELSTVRMPVSLTYFFNSKAYIGITGLFLHQDLSRVEFSNFAMGRTNTVLANIYFGYPLFNNKAHISLTARNITDTQFRYQDEQFRSAPVLRPTELVPERRISLRATYNFN